LDFSGNCEPKLIDKLNKRYFKSYKEQNFHVFQNGIKMNIFRITKSLPQSAPKCIMPQGPPPPPYGIEICG
jgi:hypothetical protein